jgi:GDPmannose 4,6-dehydratase
MAGMRLIASQPEPSDFVLASGVGHSVGDLVRAAFACVDLDPAAHVRLDESLLRSPEPVAPVGDPTRARDVLGWRATITFEQLIGEMVRADLDALA